MGVLPIEPDVSALIEKLYKRIEELEKIVEEQARIIEEWKRGHRSRSRPNSRKKR